MALFELRHHTLRDLPPILTLVFSAIWLVGSIIFLTYCLQIGYLPQGLTLADILYFLMISLGFIIVYAFVYATLFCLGAVVIRGIAIALKRSKKFTRIYVEYYKPATKTTTINSTLLQISGAFFGVVFEMVSLNISTDTISTVIFLLMPLITVSLVSLLVLDSKAFSLLSREFAALKNLEAAHNRYIDSDNKIKVIKGRKAKNESSAISSNIDFKNEYGKLAKDGRRHRIELVVSLLLVIFIPFIFGLYAPVLRGTMSIVHIREVDTTVFVKRSYCDLLKEEFPKNIAPFLYETYCEFTHMNILLTGLGSYTVIAPYTHSDHFVPIPTTDVLISLTHAPETPEKTKRQ